MIPDSTRDCEAAAALLADFLKDSEPEAAASPERHWVAQHLAACPECAAMAEMWRRLDALPAAKPDARMRLRFDQMLAAFQEGREQKPHPGRRWAWIPSLGWNPTPVLAAVILLAVGLGAGWWLRGLPSSSRPAGAQEQEIADLRQQVQSTRQLAVLSLLQQESASDRLQGVSYSSRLAGDPKIITALVHSLEYDPSPDVRLAALDALQRDSAAPGVQQALVNAFAYQKSPLLQVALVDTFVRTRDQQARPLLQRVSSDHAFIPEVRQHAAWGLAQPAWN